MCKGYCELNSLRPIREKIEPFFSWISILRVLFKRKRAERKIDMQTQTIKLRSLIFACLVSRLQTSDSTKFRSKESPSLHKSDVILLCLLVKSS